MTTAHAVDRSNRDQFSAFGGRGSARPDASRPIQSRIVPVRGRDLGKCLDLGITDGQLDNPSPGVSAFVYRIDYCDLT